ncbi:hypothetical protein MSG28_004948, partial [Choristoneura fumiferana]
NEHNPWDSCTILELGTRNPGSHPKYREVGRAAWPSEDNQVVGDDVSDDDDSVVKSSQDVDTTILFTKPIPNSGDTAFGLDGETFFLYVFLGAACVLALVLGQQALSSLARRRSPRAAPKPLETGTANDVDYDWLPKEVVNQLKKSPKTPKQSPRMRKAKRSAGDD